MNRLIKSVILLFLLTTFERAGAQTVLTIEECYKLARDNYPMIKQRELILMSREYSVERISKGNLPQVIVFGQASYQSAVIAIPFPNMPGFERPIVSKDQYKIYAEASQNLFDGGVMKQQKRIEEANAIVEEQRLEVELYKLNDRINQLYFGILLLDEQLKQNTLYRKDIELGLNRTEGAVANGTALTVNADALKAELLKSDQKKTELESARKAYLDMLGLFVQQSLDESTVLSKPVQIEATETITRPELGLYTKQTQSLQVQNQLLKARNLPKFSLFLQAGFGRPALNPISNTFDPYYIGGLRLNWSLNGLYTLHKDRSLIEVNKRGIELQKETFLFNTNMTLKQQNAERDKYNKLLQSDDEIIQLRNNVKKSYLAQLENGVITSTDYLREVNAEDQARQNKIVHEIQLLMTEYNQKTTTGL